MWDDPLEEGTATHCSILAQKISWAEKPWSIGSQRVRHDWSDLAQHGSTDNHWIWMMGTLGKSHHSVLSTWVRLTLSTISSWNDEEISMEPGVELVITYSRCSQGWIKRAVLGVSLGGSMVKTLLSTAAGCGFDPWLGTPDPTYFVAKKSKR